MNKLLIGWAKRETSINEQVEIPGQMYMRISEGIMDPLYATALCVESEGGDTVVFCSCDLGNFNTGIIDMTLSKVKALCPELPTDHIVMNCTHTHTCPNTRETVPYSPDGKEIYPGWKYREFFSSQAAEAIVEAYTSRKPGGMAYGYGYAVVAHSRRSLYFDDMSKLEEGVPVSPNGHGIMYGRTNRDEFASYEAGEDHFINLMFTTDSEGKLTGIVMNIPCPSQLSEHFSVQTADYWGDIRTAVQKEYGDDVFVLPQCAAAGDLSPRVLHYKYAQARRMGLKYGLHYDGSAGSKDHNKVMGERYDICERVMDAVREVRSWAMKDIRYEAEVSLKRIETYVEARTVTKEERAWCLSNLEKLKTMKPDPETMTPEEYREKYTHYESIRNRNEWMLEKYETQPRDDRMHSLIFCVRIGDIAFATNRYELYMDYMHRIQARSPFIQTFVVQLAGEEYGNYLPTERGVQNKGYSASLFDNTVSFRGGQEVVEATLAGLNELYS